MIHYIFSLFGFVVSKSGMIYTKTQFAKFIADLCVREGSLKEVKPNLYTVNR